MKNQKKPEGKYPHLRYRHAQHSYFYTYLICVYHKFYIKKMKLELELVHQFMYKKIIFGHVWYLAIGHTDIFHQDVSGFSCTWIMNFGHVGWLAIEHVNIFCLSCCHPTTERHTPCGARGRLRKNTLPGLIT